MDKVGNNIIKSFQNRNEAFNNFILKKEAFLQSKEQLTKDIEEARNIWKSTMEQLPNREFN